MDAEPLEGPADDDWLVVPHWDRFQHYKNRRPTWIKVYTELLSDPNYLGLSLASKGLLHVLWLAYATSDQRLTVIGLRRLCHDRFGYPQLISLNRAGFLEWRASNVLAPKKEVEKEKETSYSFSDEQAEKALLTRAIEVVADWKNGTSEDFDRQLQELENHYGTKLSTAQREALQTTLVRRNPADPALVEAILHRFTRHNGHRL